MRICIAVLSVPWNDRAINALNCSIAAKPDELLLITSREHFCPDIDNIKIIESHGNASITKNMALRETISDWIVFVDDDLSFRSDLLDHLKKSISELPDAEVIGARVHLPFKSIWKESPFLRRLLFTEYDRGSRVLKVSKVWELAMAVNKEHQAKYSAWFNENHGAGALRIGEASEFCSKFKHIYYVPEYIVNHNVDNRKLSIKSVLLMVLVRGWSRGIAGRRLGDKDDVDIYTPDIRDIVFLIMYCVSYCIGLLQYGLSFK